MSTFTSPLQVEFINIKSFKILTEFDFYYDDIIIKVPKGFITDLASTPRILWAWIPPHDIYAKAAVIHDYMYINGLYNKKIADECFLEGLKVLGVGKIKRTLMYFSVKLFGKGNY